MHYNVVTTDPVKVVMLVGEFHEGDFMESSSMSFILKEILEIAAKEFPGVSPDKLELAPSGSGCLYLYEIRQSPKP